jgi:DNA-binding Xre family transcriptional regulator
MKWNLRWAAARRDIWRPSDLLKAFEDVGFEPSLSKVAALWSGKPVSVRLDDLDKMCAALGCTVADLLEADLLEAEPLAAADGGQEQGKQAVGAGDETAGPARPTPRRGGPRRSLPPN